MMEVDSPAEALISSRLKICHRDDDIDSEVRSIFSDRVPFSATNSKNDLKYFKSEFEKSKSSKISNKENNNNLSKGLPHVRSREQMESPDSITDGSNKNECNSTCSADLETQNVSRSNSENPPLTPTANLKMLFNAVSQVENEHSDSTSDVDISNDTCDSKPDSFTHSEFDCELMSSQDSESGKTGSRKEKSLGLLCQKFLHKYKEYPDPNDDSHICLDEVAKELNTERRRIYDIVNVLESVEIVSRRAKNRYLWHGKTNLVTTLAKLKALAESEGFAEQIHKVKDFEFNRELEALNGKSTEASQKQMNDLFGAGSLLRKDKSLGIMSQKFLMLFLVSKPKIVNLDLSAKILIGDPTVDRTENAKFKTKIRRLYDIANILSSLDLICKVHVTEIRGRKPAFKYIGPDVDSITDISICSNDGHHRPSSRHSLLDCIKNQNVASIMSNYRPIRPYAVNARVEMVEPGLVVPCAKGAKTEAVGIKKMPFSRHASFDQICQVAERERSKALARHSSFDEICAVAEKERSKLFSSVSQQSSPFPTNNSLHVTDSSTESKPSTPKESRIQEITKKSVGQKKHYIFMHNKGQFRVVKGLDDKSVKNMSVFSAQNIASSVAKQVMSESGLKSPENKGETKKPVRTETIIIKTKGIQGSQKNSPVILTEDQIAAVLKSLKNPVKVSKIPSSLMDASTQSSPVLTSEESNDSKDLKDLNERTPVQTLSSVDDQNFTGKHKLAIDNRNIPEVKKIKVDLLTPPSEVATKCLESNNRSVSKEKPSSKALHLVPEFKKAPLDKIIKFNPSAQTCRKISYSDMDLASPLSDEDSNDSVQFTVNKKVLEKTESAFRPVPHQQPSVVGPNKKCDVKSSLSTVHNSFPHSNEQTVSSSSKDVNFTMPLTYSPPITPNNPSQQTVFTFPALQTVHLVHPTPIKFSSSFSSASQTTSVSTPENQNIIAGKLISTPTTFFGNTPSTSARSFLPIQQSAKSSDCSDSNGGTARQLNMFQPL